MRTPRICVVITQADEAAVQEAEKLADLFEIRIDLLKNSWMEIAHNMRKPWIATNRSAKEGGQWREGEPQRKEELLKALRMGADIIDVELSTPGLEEFVPIIKKDAMCLVSFHDMQGTPPAAELERIVKAELAAGADICKVATTATGFEDNNTVLQLIKNFPGIKIVALAMGPKGQASRVMCPLMGGEFTYASLKSGQESASAQITLGELHRLYRLVALC